MNAKPGENNLLRRDRSIDRSFTRETGYTYTYTCIVPFDRVGKCRGKTVGNRHRLSIEREQVRRSAYNRKSLQIFRTIIILIYYSSLCLAKQSVKLCVRNYWETWPLQHFAASYRRRCSNDNRLLKAREVSISYFRQTNTFSRPYDLNLLLFFII